MQYLLFDLDGTLTDSGPGIANAVRHALTYYGIPEEEFGDLRRFVGPPLYDSFHHFYGVPKERCQELVDVFRAYYRPIGIFENTPYPGIADCLSALKDAGKTLAVATSKPQDMAELVLARFGLASYFDHICGASLDESAVAKPGIIAKALTLCGVTDKSQVLMIGDRWHDISGAKDNAISSMGVLYGYGSRSELEDAGADYLAETTADISRIVLSL